jgi:hypothetical protein
LDWRNDGDPLAGYFGPNFIFNAVPEPSTYIGGALLLLPFGLQGIRHLRERRHAA